MTIGYRLNEDYWHKLFAKQACRLMVDYLSEMADVKQLFAYVMPENIYSAKVLIANGFEKLPYTQEAHDWGGQENVILDVYRYITHPVLTRDAPCGE